MKMKSLLLQQITKPDKAQHKLFRALSVEGGAERTNINNKFVAPVTSFKFPYRSAM